MAGFKIDKKVIGDRTFTVRQLPIGKGGLDVLTRVLQIVLPGAAAALQQGATLSQVVNAANPGALGASVLQGVASRMDNATLEHLSQVFGETTTVDGGGLASLVINKPDTRDMVFAGDYLTYFEWLAFCLEVNYRDFFQGLLRRIASVVAVSKQPAAA